MEHATPEANPEAIELRASLAFRMTMTILWLGIIPAAVWKDPGYSGPELWMKPVWACIKWGLVPMGLLFLAHLYRVLRVDAEGLTVRVAWKRVLVPWRRIGGYQIRTAPRAGDFMVVTDTNSRA